MVRDEGFNLSLYSKQLQAPKLCAFNSRYYHLQVNYASELCLHVSPDYVNVVQRKINILMLFLQNPRV